ncbi:hypothetical protein BaRGS_00021366 [Batillaria attramentaria]|uniref:Tyr recombinase domain-containing protein n=1 Tax=Batillaria attramentaria TaxID=370345 RepID=A0ABD0KJY6_9CAEN
MNTARSAISAVVQTHTDRSIGTDPRIVRFMKGAYELRPALPRYKDTWDVEQLLGYIRTWKNNSELSLKLLTMKLCALLLLASAQRLQTIHLIKKEWIEFHEQGCRIHILDKVKHSKPASKDTIARWMRTLLREAGIENCTPHSFRGASASAMMKSGVTLADICKKAGWSNASTFYKFYYRQTSTSGETTERKVKPAQKLILDYTV